MTKKMSFKNTFLTSTAVGDLEESEDLRLHLEFQADINTKSRYIALMAELCPSEMNTTSSFTTTMPPWSIYGLAQTSKTCWKHNASSDLFHWRIREIYTEYEYDAKIRQMYCSLLFHYAWYDSTGRVGNMLATGPTKPNPQEKSTPKPKQTNKRSRIPLTVFIIRTDPKWSEGPLTSISY